MSIRIPAGKKLNELDKNSFLSQYFVKVRIAGHSVSFLIRVTCEDYIRNENGLVLGRYATATCCCCNAEDSVKCLLPSGEYSTFEHDFWVDT
jgi:hypothetical protein